MENNYKYFDNLLDSMVYSLEGIYDEEYIRKNYTSPTSKIRKILKNLQTNGFIVKDNIVNKYRVIPYKPLQFHYLEVNLDNQKEEIEKYIYRQPQPSVASSFPYAPYAAPTYPYYIDDPVYCPNITCAANQVNSQVSSAGMDPNASIVLTNSKSTEE